MLGVLLMGVLAGPVEVQRPHEEQADEADPQHEPIDSTPPVPAPADPPDPSPRVAEPALPSFDGADARPDDPPTDAPAEQHSADTRDEEEAVVNYRTGRSPLLAAGVATTIVGVIATGGAVILATTAPCGSDGATGADCTRDPRVLGSIGLGTIGGAVLIGGVVMTVVGVRRQRNKRVTFRPAFRRNLVGLVVEGRF